MKLADIATIQGGGTPSRSEPSFFGGDLPWVTPSDLAPIGEVTTLGEVAESLTHEGLRASSAKLLSPGSVLFSSRASIGKIAVTDRACATNQGFINLTPDSELVDSWFLAYLLAWHREDLIQLAGKTTFLEISRGKFKDFEVLLPPVPEQRRIVSRIKACMERVEEIESLRDGADQESSQLLRAFYRDIYSEILSASTCVPLSQVARATGGGTPSKQRAEFWRGSIPWISPKDMKVRDLSSSTDRISEEAIQGSAAKLIDRPSVLFVVRGMILAHTVPVAVSRVPLAINQDMKALTPNDGIDVDFLATMVRGAESRLLRMVEVAGHGTRRLQTASWAGLPVPLLEPESQRKVVDRAKSAERLADAMVEHRPTAEVSLLRDSILRKAFAGEL